MRDINVMDQFCKMKVESVDLASTDVINFRDKCICTYLFSDTPTNLLSFVVALIGGV